MIIFSSLVGSKSIPSDRAMFAVRQPHQTWHADKDPEHALASLYVMESDVRHSFAARWRCKLEAKLHP